MRKLEDIRIDIDSIDSQIRDLIMKRLDCSEEVVAAKIADKNYVIYRADREAAMLERLGKGLPEDRREGYLALVRKITETSRSHQYDILFEEVPELFETLTKDLSLPGHSREVELALSCPDRPNGLSALLSMIGDRGFDLTRLEKTGEDPQNGSAAFRLTLRGDIGCSPLKRLLLQLSMEAEDFRILQFR